MNEWTQYSIEIWSSVENAYKKKNNDLLVRELLQLDLFSIKDNNKMYKSITETYRNYNIMSALVLRNSLYQI
jgi:hypothetical protein